MSISLCMIAKDEEEFIEEALESVKGLVDEIIIVDTGSKDKTKEIALLYGAIVIESNWRKDFSYHRNESIKLATGDWILILDCDEVIKRFNIEAIKEILDKQIESGGSLQAYNINIVNIINGKEIACFKNIRLFRNNVGLRFMYPIHEQIVSSNSQSISREVIGTLKATIFHFGYDEKIQIKKGKRKRNLEILETIKEKDGYFYAMTGDEYLQSNDLLQAEKYYSLSINNTRIEEIGYAQTMVVNYVTTLVNLRKYGEAMNLLRYTKKIIPYFTDLYFLEFWVSYYSNSYKNALINLEKYISLINGTNEKTLTVKNFGAIYNLEQLLNDCKSRL